MRVIVRVQVHKPRGYRQSPGVDYRRGRLIDFPDRHDPSRLDPDIPHEWGATSSIDDQAVANRMSST